MKSDLSLARVWSGVIRSHRSDGLQDPVQGQGGTMLVDDVFLLHDCASFQTGSGSAEPVSEGCETSSPRPGNMRATAMTSSSLSKDSVTVWRSEEHTSELQSLMRISFAVF